MYSALRRRQPARRGRAGPSISEVMVVNGPTTFYVEREGRIERVCEGMKRRSTQPMVLDHVGPPRCDSRRIGE
jgi:hypothetical protein